MDELTVIREIGADTPEPEALALRRARKQLLEAAGAELPRVRRPLIRVAAAAAVAALVTGGVVVGETFWRDGNHRVVASADAVDVLDRAAKAALAQNDPVVGEDQYLKVAFDERYLAEGALGDDHAAALLGSTRALYVPGDPDNDWVLELSAHRIVEVYRGDDPDFGDLGHAETLRARDGGFYGSLGEDWGSPSPEFLDSLPRDREELRDRLYDDSDGGGQSEDGNALTYIADIIRSGRVPADLRAALFEVAKTIPGVAVTDDAAVLDGRRGVAIGHTEGVDGVRSELVFDRTTGLLIGERVVVVGDKLNLPAGTVTTSTAITTSVVNEAP